MKIKKSDFIEVDYVGRIKESKQIFDLTIEKIARDENVYQEDAKYKPIVICVGEGDVVEGLDEALEGKEDGKEYEIEVPYDKGFGKRDPKLTKVVNTNMFIKQQIQPMPGVQVDFGGMTGVIKTVNGGRTTVDFNHPLAGRNLLYKITINKVITDDEEKLKGLVAYHLQMPDPKVKIENGDTAVIESEIPDMFKEKLEEKIKTLIPSITKVKIVTTEKKKEETDEK